MGAELCGVDAATVTEEQFEEIRDALFRHKMIYLRNQKLSHSDHEAFSLRFGPFAEDAYTQGVPGYRNVRPLIKEADDTSKMVFGEGWHTDSPFLSEPPSITILYSVEVPPVGGDTTWANLVRKIKGNAHPMVRTHPVSGEKALYVDSAYAIGIEGMPTEESAPILHYLTEHLTQPAFTCRLRWEPNMLDMNPHNDVASELARLVGADIVVAPDPQNIVRHTSDYCVQGNPAVGILALTYPRETQQISAILRYCNQRHVAVQPQGGMTGLAGGAVPVGPCVVVSLERMRAIRELDRAAGTITVEAGVVMEAVQKAADAADLFFPLDIGGRGSCQVGGNVSTNAGGNRVLRFGMARDLVLGVEAVLADGTVINALSKVIKNNTGYDLRQLFIGSEGTLGIVTAVVLRLFPKARSVSTGICAVGDYAGVLDLLQRARSGFGSQLTAFEVMWPEFYQVGTVNLGRKPPLDLGYGSYVLIETMGLDPEADQQRYETVIGAAMEAGSVKDAIIVQSQREAAELWTVRDSPGEWQRAGHWPQLSFDVSVSTGEIGQLVAEIDSMLKARWPALTALYFGHVADGNLHVSVRMSGHAVPELDIEQAVYSVVSKRRGSISAEHGIGLLKKDFLHLSRSPEEIALMRTIKKAMDPNGILNPGKIF